jgi:hypothetical protein
MLPRRRYPAYASPTQARDWDSAMAVQESETRQCPFCKEEVKADAVRCKHCQAAIPLLKPEHQGICPFCKETINPEAIRCMHCGANLAPPQQYSYYPERPLARRVLPRQTTAPLAHTIRAVERGGSERPVRTRPVARSADPGCADYDIDSQGTWCFLESSEHYCIYELCDPIASTPGF